MSSKISSFLEDAVHHLYEFIQPISESTSHLYVSFLSLKRSESDVARHYSRNIEEPASIEYIGDKATSGCIKQIRVDGDVSSVSFCNRNQVLSGSSSGVCLWSVDSGELIRGPFAGDTIVPFPYFVDRILLMNRDGVVGEWCLDTGIVSA